MEWSLGTVYLVTCALYSTMITISLYCRLFLRWPTLRP